LYIVFQIITYQQTKFYNKLILKLGASSGIGEGIAIKFAQLGCRLTLSGRSTENLQRVNDLCKEAGLNKDQVINPTFLVNWSMKICKTLNNTLSI
jgi:NADP-dependent 3-hydroxy acid dehydrogenase YdfG